MKTETVAKTERLTAEERRDDVLRAAIIEFAEFGLHGASTEAIARRAGISQPYIFRLFGTKKELFMAATGVCYRRILQGFETASATAKEQGSEILPAIGQTYAQWLSYREELLLLLHSFAACHDPEVRAMTRECFHNLYIFIEDVSGAEPQDIQQFMAHGMLMTIAAAMDLPALAGQQQWACALLGDFLKKF
jgi:AcrR family transcriptional regulator